MSISPLLAQSSRIALAAFLHDLGKFAERAKIPIDRETLDANKQNASASIFALIKP